MTCVKKILEKVEAVRRSEGERGLGEVEMLFQAGWEIFCKGVFAEGLQVGYRGKKTREKNKQAREERGESFTEEL